MEFSAGDHVVSYQDIHDVLSFFSDTSNPCDRRHAMLATVQKKVEALFALDYNYSKLSNQQGELCGHYPLDIIILHSVKQQKDDVRTPPQELGTPVAASPSAGMNGITMRDCQPPLPPAEANQRLTRDLAERCRFARARTRFVVPVILLDGTNICRSATLSNQGEIFLREGNEMVTKLFTGVQGHVQGLFSSLPVGARDNLFPQSQQELLLQQQEYARLQHEAGRGCHTASAPEARVGLPSSSTIDNSSGRRASDTHANRNGFDSSISSSCHVIGHSSGSLSQSNDNSGHGHEASDLSLSDLEADTSFDEAFASASPPREDENTSLVDRYRNADLEMLKVLGVRYICDLMVEHRKIKCGVPVTSSEKADTRARYREFQIATVPFPGVEWFRGFKQNNYDATTMRPFDWTSPAVDARLCIPADYHAPRDTEWADYRSWSTVDLTRNYLRLFLRLIRANPDGDSGLLVHCISGWDRTPLFISLMRMSLWADEQIHKSLSATQMLYLTITYDWMLFGHQLKDRRVREEDIFVFCFDFLQYISGPEFEYKPGQWELEDSIADAVGELLTPCPSTHSAKAPGAPGLGVAATANTSSSPLASGVINARSREDSSHGSSHVSPRDAPEGSLCLSHLVDDDLHLGSTDDLSVSRNLSIAIECCDSLIEQDDSERVGEDDDEDGCEGACGLGGIPTIVHSMPITITGGRQRSNSLEQPETGSWQLVHSNLASRSNRAGLADSASFKESPSQISNDSCSHSPRAVRLKELREAFWANYMGILHPSSASDQRFFGIGSIWPRHNCA